MSFGFSVGDIILLSQLSYKLYSSVTKGRRGAGRDLKELEDVLFGLRCALDHLSNVANNVLETTQNTGDKASVDMREKLNSMIDSCGSTLQDLDSLTQKYRNGTKPAVSDGNDNRSKKVSQSLARITQNFNINWMKIRWDMERYSLQYYRDKLRSHADAINIVMNAFLWYRLVVSLCHFQDLLFLRSTTHRVEIGEKARFEKTQGLLNQALLSNTTLLELVTEIHNKLHTLNTTPSLQVEEKVSPLIPEPRTLPFRGLTPSAGGAMGPQKMNIPQLESPFANVALMTITQFPDATYDDNPKPSVEPYAMTMEWPNKRQIAPYIVPNATPKQLMKQLPAPIIELNNRRQITGLKEFEEFKAKNVPPKQVHRPSFLALDVRTLPQLHDGLTYIFRPFSLKTGSQARNALDERKKEIVRWTHGFDHLLNSWLSQTIPSSSYLEEQNNVVDLLVHLNELIEKTDGKMRKLFYDASTQAQIDGVLDKLQTVSKSVRVQKEVEEFEDEKAEWVGEYEER